MGGYISLHNASTAFSDAELIRALPDLQAQVSYGGEFWWHWGLNAQLDINGSGTPIIIVDYPESDSPADSLGYHYVDGKYQPYAVIFAALCRDKGKPTTAVISHELLEMLANQHANTLSLIPTGNDTGIIVCREVCDPCEVSVYYEAGNGSVVADFALPGWWVPGYPFQVDFLGVLPGPLRVASGAHIAYEQVTLAGPRPDYRDTADLDMNTAADAMRAELAAAYDSRESVLRQLTASRGLQPATASDTPTDIARAKAVSAIPERLRQPSTLGARVQVVPRANVPTYGPAASTSG